MLSQVHVALDIFYQHIVYVYWGVVYNHHLCLCSTSPSKSVVNTNRCKYVILFHVSFGPLFKSVIVSYVLHPKHAHDAKLLC